MIRVELEATFDDDYEGDDDGYDGAGESTILSLSVQIHDTLPLILIITASKLGTLPAWHSVMD